MSLNTSDADSFSATATAELEKIKGDIITQSLSKLNNYGTKKSKTKKAFSSMTDTYNLSKSILSAAYEGKGTIIDNSQ